MKSNLLRLIVSALFAALTFVATFMVQIPALFGYVNLGDCFVLLSGALLGPIYGFAAAGLGSVLADLLLGFSVYAPATFLIKGVMALIMGLVAKKANKKIILKITLFGALCEILMALSYFLYECFILGYDLAAAAVIPANLFQGAVGLAAFLILYGVISRNKKLNNFLRLK